MVVVARVRVLAVVLSVLHTTGVRVVSFACAVLVVLVIVRVHSLPQRGVTTTLAGAGDANSFST